ncbi:MAG: biopolymer transporter ExbD [Comamonadaceae bacterium]|nr:biopolymer transporter ExbD [Comamonadaceae bacterium]
MGEINVVPYIDVMLVLLIIFMVTAPMLSAGHQGRPAAGRGRAAAVGPRAAGAERRRRRAACTSTSAIRKRPLEPDAGAGSGLGRRCAGNLSAPCWSRQTGRSQYGRVVEGMALLQQAGAQKVGFATESPARAPRKSGTR